MKSAHDVDISALVASGTVKSGRISIELGGESKGARTDRQGRRLLPALQRYIN
jgi:hypothetical protein